MSKTREGEMMSTLRKGDYVVWRSSSGVRHHARVVRVNKLTVRIHVLDDLGGYELTTKPETLEKVETTK